MTENTSSMFTPKGNPLEHLTDAQVDALNKSFTKSWKKAGSREDEINTFAETYSMDEFTAAFTVALIEEAETKISNGIVTDAAALMAKQAQLIVRGSVNTIEEALRTVKNQYEELSATQRKEAGKKFRKQVFAANTNKDYRKIIDAVVEHLEERESNWM